MALCGVKVVELPGLAPVSLCAMVLADFGASVTRVDRIGRGADVTARGKRSIAIDMKRPEGVALVRSLCKDADVVVEPFRPGVMERLGLGPEVLMADNPRLIYARLTGWGQSGPMHLTAGHDINYLALSGVLAKLGRAGAPPTPPVNLLGDFAGGSVMCALGIMAALLERGRSGKGQVVDAAMVEGAAYLGSWLNATAKLPGLWGKPRGENILDSGAHFYNTYRTKDGKYVAVGCIEKKFYAEMLRKLGVSRKDIPHIGAFPALERKLATVFATKTRDEWAAVFAGSDACVTPVLDADEAARHPQNAARGVYLPSGMPRPAPRLSRTPAAPDPALPTMLKAGTHTDELLVELGVPAAQAAELKKAGVVAGAPDGAKL